MSRFSRVFVISQEVGVSKPDALIAKAALEGAGLHRSGARPVGGDSVSADIMLARNAGLRSCLMFSFSPLRITAPIPMTGCFPCWAANPCIASSFRQNQCEIFGLLLQSGQVFDSSAVM